ncbi:MAG: hypothetical protein JSV33_02755 [bacterium]|nr:MAG: hypothetical protein JSV33_02755 [bacterium]
MRVKCKIILAYLILIFLFSCSSDNPIDPVNEIDIERIHSEIIDIQDACDTVLTNLLAGMMDTTTAKDSVLSVFLEYPSVAWGTVTGQGILIEYESGVRGGIILDYGEDQGAWPQEIKCDYISGANGNLGSQNIIPKSKSTAFIFPIRFEEQEYTKLGNEVMDIYNDCFPRAGYTKPSYFPDDQATVDLFANLDSYGVIHILSHGVVWENSVGIVQKIYLLTGEKESIPTSEKYKNDLTNKRLALFKYHEGLNMYECNADWFATNNNFGANTSLVIGQFCEGFHNKSDWPSAMTSIASVGCFIGFKGKAVIPWGADCVCEAILHLTDIEMIEPMTVGDWFATPGNVPKEFKGARIEATERLDLALWEIPETCKGFPPPPGESHTYRAEGSTYTFTLITEEVDEEVNGYTVYRIWRTDNPPGLGMYIGCDPEYGEVDVATDWWNYSNPSVRGRYYWEPPAYYCQYGDEAGTTVDWNGTFKGKAYRIVSEVIGYESITVPYGTYTNAMKIKITEYTSGGIFDEPLYFWFDRDIGILRLEEVDGGDPIVLISYNPAISNNEALLCANPRGFAGTYFSITRSISKTRSY